MYKSKFEVERKLKQINYIYTTLLVYENKIYANNGMDEKTGSYPIEIILGTFLIYCRSIFQFAYEEAKENELKKKKYDAYINQNKIISFFKKLRDSEIHSFAISTNTTIILESPILAEMTLSKLTKYSTKKELIESGKIPEPKTIFRKFLKRVEITPEIIRDLNSKNETRLLESIKAGKPIFEQLEFDNKSDIFELCNDYLTAIKKFIDYGLKEGLIT